MSLIVVPTGTGYSTGGISLPDMVSFCVDDTDGAGGTVYINGLGIVDSVVSGAVDLKTLFTTNGGLFNSYPLLRAFRPIYATDVNVLLTQMVKNLEISYYALGQDISGDPPFALRFLQLLGIGSGGASTPYLGITAPAGGEGYEGDLWRVELKLRHSITN